jgi:hypothetical protein
MDRIIRSWAAAAALLVCVIAAAPAEATVDHTYVSGTGTDTGGCISSASACRHFAYALTQTSAAGEIIVLNPADYGPVSINQSISIVADGGGPAGIILATGTAITIDVGFAAVNLRGLTLDGEGTATSGIVSNYAAGSVLTVSDCVVRNFKSAGIVLHGTKNLVVNSVISNNGGVNLNGGNFNCQISPSSYCAGLVLVGNNQEPGYATVRNSVFNENAIGLAAEGESVDNGGSILTIANTIVTGSSQYGVLIGTAGVVYSYGDNEINGNGTNISGGTLTLVAKQ